jgi:hypothetical protein
MKAALVYYSFSGNTRTACSFLESKLGSLGCGAEAVPLKPEPEEANFFRQGQQAATRATPPLGTEPRLPGGTGLAVFASPVWAFTFAPALRSFLKDCPGFEGMDCACFLTCGSRLTSGNALKELERAVAGKGGKLVFSTYVRGTRTGDNRYLEEIFSGLFNTLPKL